MGTYSQRGSPRPPPQHTHTHTPQHLQSPYDTATPQPNPSYAYKSLRKHSLTSSLSVFYSGIEGLTGECIDIARVGTYFAEIDLDGVTMRFFRAPCSVASLQNAGPSIWKGNEWNQMCQMGGDVGWQSYVIFNNGDGGW